MIQITKLNLKDKDKDNSRLLAKYLKLEIKNFKVKKSYKIY